MARNWTIFFPEIEKKVRMPPLMCLLNIILEVTASVLRQEKEMKAIHIRKEKQNHLSLPMPRMCRKSQRINQKSHETNEQFQQG